MDRKNLISELKSDRMRSWDIPSSPIKFESIAWTPDFISEKNIAVLTIGNEVQPFLQKRIIAAKEAGYTIHCICSLSVLSEAENLIFFSDVDAKIILNEQSASSLEFLPLLKALAIEQIAVDRDARSRLVSNGLQKCLVATTNDEKGKSLEWLLHFMFSQVRDFRVVSCNYHTTNEELDVLIQLRAINPEYSWSHKSAPLIIVEAKNRKERQGQEIVSKLHTIIQTKSGNCKIGILVSLSGFTSGASDQRLKLSMSDITFVMMDKDDLQQWADANDYEGSLDTFVRQAMLP